MQKTTQCPSFSKDRWTSQVEVASFKFQNCVKDIPSGPIILLSTPHFSTTTCTSIPEHPASNTMSSSKPTPKSRQQVLNAKYGSPLPILLPNSSTGPQFQKGKSTSSSHSTSLLSTYAPSLTAEIIVPQCQGVYDPITRSVWVTDRKDMDILFRRGFFGKGTLSRSEPSWRERRVDLLKGGDSESITLT